jgi:hypothetical protein
MAGGYGWDTCGLQVVYRWVMVRLRVGYGWVTVWLWVGYGWITGELLLAAQLVQMSGVRDNARLRCSDSKTVAFFASLGYQTSKTTSAEVMITNLIISNE